MAREDGYQQGLHDGLIAAYKDSNGRTVKPNSAAGRQLLADLEGTIDAEAADYEATIAGLEIGTGRI
jgi:hypothetical protein